MRYIMSGEHFGFARFVGLGNKVDVDETEILEYYGKDPETKAIFIYLESFKRPKPFLEIASKVTCVKPIMLLKGGSTPDGACTAVAYTAALASDDRIIDGVLRRRLLFESISIRTFFSLPRPLPLCLFPREIG